VVLRFAEAGGDTDQALDALERFLAVVPGHVARSALIDVRSAFYEHQRATAPRSSSPTMHHGARKLRAGAPALRAADHRAPGRSGVVQRLGRAMAGLGFADGEREACSRVQRLTAAEARRLRGDGRPPRSSSKTSRSGCAGRSSAWALPSAVIGGRW
jgi:hypothetical protein